MMAWTPTAKDKKFGVVVYNFFGGQSDQELEILDKHCLKLKIGDPVCILEECEGWFRGYSLRDPSKKTGIFPTNHIAIKPYSIYNGGDVENEDAVSLEAAEVIREWTELWHELYLLRDHEKFNQLKKLMEQLLDLRRQLISGHLTGQQRADLKMKIVDKIHLGTRLLDLDIVPRELDGQAVNPKLSSPVHLFNRNVDTAQKLLHPGERPSMAGLSSHIEKKRDLRKNVNHHLHVKLTEFSYPFSEDMEIYLALYSAKENAFVSEKFRVHNLAVMEDAQSGAIFKDAGNLDQIRDLHLICHVIKSNRMGVSGTNDAFNTLTSSTRKSTCFRRPFACGVMNISKIITKGPGNVVEFETKLQMADDKDFYHLHEQIIKKSNAKFGPAPGGNPGACIKATVRLLPGDANNAIKREYILKPTPEVPRLGFANVIMPGEVRNDLYLTVDRGNFERGGKAAARNIEVTVCVVDQAGQVIDNSVFYSMNQGSAKLALPIIYHNNSPIWNEYVRIQVPMEKFYHAHIRLEFRHCSAKDKSDKKLLGFSFVHLMELDETTIKDGVHTLCLYKCEDSHRLENSGIYLAMPSKLNEVTSLEQVILSHGFVRSAKENVTISTKLVSTKLTQNPDLMRLLNWKSNNQQSVIGDTLTKIMSMSGEDIVKFLQDILDTLFAMFSTEDGNSTPYSGLVFHVLVSIISSLEEPKFEHFKPVLDAYIDHHFAAALVYKGLLSCVRHCADLVTSTERQEPIQKCFRSLEYISKFIIQSRQLFARATQGQNEDGFRVDVHLVFNSFNKMLSVSYDTILPAQVLFLEHIGKTYPFLLKELAVLDLAKLVTLMFDSVSTCGALMHAKMGAILEAIHSPIFNDNESRSLLLPTCCEHIRMHLLAKEELKLCSQVLGEIISFLRQRKSESTAANNDHDLNAVQKDVDVLVESLLVTLIEAISSMDKQICSLIVGGLVSRLLGLFELMDEQPHFLHLWDRLATRGAVKDFLLNTFHLFNELVTKDVYPPEWATMRVVANHILIKTIEDLAKPLTTYFRDEDRYFDSHPWTVYFHLGVSFLSQSSLQLEKYSNCKRQRVLDNYGDMRHQMACQLLSLWSHLGQLKLHFIPGMVGPFLEMTLIPEPELRKATIPLFFDLLECEYKAKGSFKQVESELIDKLDILVSENKGDEDYKLLFNSILVDNLTQKDPVWRENGKSFVDSVTRLLERLLDYRNVGQGEENRDKRMSCTVNLLNFYRSEKNRKEMYLRYIYKLHDLHIPAGSFTEAAFTLKLHADDLEWSNRPLHSDLRYPSQKEWQRKEQLYQKIIEYFEKDKQWECAIPLCKELAQVYEKRIVDYAKLADILRKQASLFEKVISSTEEGLRFDPEYFRVGFYGQGFPLFLRNKDFIYRGQEFEKISTFTQRLSAEFPHAQVLTSNSREPDEALKSEDGQFVQICCVKALSSSLAKESAASAVATMDGYEIPEKIRKFHQVNNVDQFQYDRPYHKGNKDRDNEFKTLWIERITYTTECPLPGILRWFEVVRSKSTHISPIEHACETIKAKNTELRGLVLDPEPVLKLTQSLQGVIDAAVNGGLAKYQSAFFHQELPPDKVAHLQSLMTEQVNILEAGLDVHKNLASNDLQPLHCHLVERFATMKNSIILKNSSSSKIVNTPLPPVPMTSSGGSNSSVLEYEGIYSKPSELVTSGTSSLSSSCYNYVWSSSLDNYSPPPPRPPSTRMKAYNEATNHHHHYHHHHRDSGIHVSSIGSSEDVSAPPLPPRSSYGSMTFSSSRSSRLSTFSSLTAMESTSVAIAEANTLTTSPSSSINSDEQQPPKLSPRLAELVHHQDVHHLPPPPPIPPKKAIQESSGIL